MTLYTARRARGAPPRATPVARPWTLTPSTTAPAAMDAVCVPCPIMSRADIWLAPRPVLVDTRPSIVMVLKFIGWLVVQSEEIPTSCGQQFMLLIWGNTDHFSVGVRPTVAIMGFR
ncbi:unknown protein [Oryza sativa Japonica Group]|uniref:Os01g0795300 protein n=2 Tax=Oryza sativa subsp. japonica TaxID=39947 RepID=Q0JIK3_ORYSJ|nr:hypothetical protein EE612_006262 [Oryza sativa]BAD53016.1 unknown protein [Oryza sativa Japonica Group]BAF06425.1 Os01g0795300 [Oryza sativa Japonica Group]BAS74752.1 Os01g0795300 [Oryza sativa Japonica Group]|eukprot:NP_001044511.1 Os01g0795300 [Oryza sativa Japonica Group]